MINACNESEKTHYIYMQPGDVATGGSRRIRLLRRDVSILRQLYYWDS